LSFNPRRWLLQIALPMTKLMNQLHISPSYRKVKSRDYRDLIQKIQPGDVLLTWRWGELSNLFIPGEWSHAALYVGNDTVREATYAGVHDTDLIDFMLEKDQVLVLRPAVPSKVIEEAILVSADALGVPYDFMFDEGDKAFYCSELICWSYNHAYFSVTGSNFPLQRQNIMGVWTVTPDDLQRAEKVFVQLCPVFGQKGN